MAHHETADPLTPGTYRFEQGVGTRGDEVTWGFDLTVIDREQ